MSSKRLDPNGLAGAFAPEPRASLDFLIPPTPEGEAPKTRKKPSRPPRKKRAARAKATARKKIAKKKVTKKKATKKKVAKKAATPKESARPLAKRDPAAEKTTTQALPLRPAESVTAPRSAMPVTVRVERAALETPVKQTWAPGTPPWPARQRERLWARIDGLLAACVRRWMR